MCGRIPESTKQILVYMLDNDGKMCSDSLSREARQILTFISRHERGGVGFVLGVERGRWWFVALVLKHVTSS